MKQKRLDKAKVLADPTARMLTEYVHALADLAQPKGCIPLLQDQSRLVAFQTAIESALHDLPGMQLEPHGFVSLSHTLCAATTHIVAPKPIVVNLVKVCWVLVACYSICRVVKSYCCCSCTGL